MMSMTENKKEPRKPDFRGRLEIAVWKNKDKNNNDYLSMKLFGQTINLFPLKDQDKK